LRANTLTWRRAPDFLRHAPGSDGFLSFVFNFLRSKQSCNDSIFSLFIAENMVKIPKHAFKCG
jgi:hypothetical protein